MILKDNFRDAYKNMLTESLDQRELEVELGVGLGPGIKKFSMRGDTITITGMPKDTGKYSATIKVTGKNAIVKTIVGKLNQKVRARIFDALGEQDIYVKFEK